MLNWLGVFLVLVNIINFLMGWFNLFFEVLLFIVLVFICKDGLLLFVEIEILVMLILL